MASRPGREEQAVSLSDAFKTILCNAFTSNVDQVGWHTANPGATGLNDSTVTHVALTWSAPDNGVSLAQATFIGLTGAYTHLGLWSGAAFRQGLEMEINYAAPADVTVLFTHTAGETS